MFDLLNALFVVIQMMRTGFSAVNVNNGHMKIVPVLQIQNIIFVTIVYKRKVKSLCSVVICVISFD